MRLHTNTRSMKSKANPVKIEPEKKGNLQTEEERNIAIINLVVEMLVEQTLKEFYEEDLLIIN